MLCNESATRQRSHIAFPGGAFFCIGAALSWETVLQKLLVMACDRIKCFMNNKHFA